ncbi:hypothetical protein Tco_0198804 [Tanacetum coccineum]
MFSKEMSSRFKMSMMGKCLSFYDYKFLKVLEYALEMLEKYEMESSDDVDTPIVERSKLDDDLQGTLEKPTENHLTMVKRVFRYLKRTINLGLWYSKDTNIGLTAFVDDDHAGCQN